MNPKLFLPSLQGAFGNWTYYVALIDLSELVTRVTYARELQSNPRLSELIQRRLDEDQRGKDIADYLIKTDDRFFNSLVVGVLGGAPSWHPFALGTTRDTHDLGDVVERDQDLVGYLELRGDERLFALDGQHRLAGIKQALQEDPKLGKEKIAVIFVPHQPSSEGLRRTRGLFISLNKRAVPVKKRDIIALDEVDLPAIITRQLLDDHPSFSNGQVDLESFTNSLPATSPYWTTIGNFYDLNAAILEGVIEEVDAVELQSAKRNRLPEDRIAFYSAQIADVYRRISALDPALAEVFANRDIAGICRAAKSAETPHLLFRPVGLKLLLAVATEYRKSLSLDETFRQLPRVPALLTLRPFSDTIWNEERGRMNLRGESMAKRLLLYMLSLQPSTEKLRQAYADWLGVERGSVRLPNRLPEL